MILLLGHAEKILHVMQGRKFKLIFFSFFPNKEVIGSRSPL